MASLVVLTSDESLEEIDKILFQKEAYVNSAGQIRTSSNVDTIAWVLRSMTGN